MANGKFYLFSISEMAIQRKISRSFSLSLSFSRFRLMCILRFFFQFRAKRTDIRYSCQPIHGPNELKLIKHKHQPLSPSHSVDFVPFSFLEKHIFQDYLTSFIFLLLFSVECFTKYVFFRISSIESFCIFNCIPFVWANSVF